MIHQYIFAGPKPGLSAEAFVSYWTNMHAVDYAAKIPQVLQYLVAGRVGQPGKRQLPFFEGVAEIWLKDDAEELAAMQSPELQAARADEPRWAAFWATFGLDTEVTAIVGRDGADDADYTKLYLLLKRAPDLPLDGFREQLRARAATLTGNRPPAQHVIAFARDNAYGMGEPRFDAIEVLSFTDPAAPAALLADPAFDAGLASGWSLCDPRHVYTFIGRDAWIVRPGTR